MAFSHSLTIALDNLFVSLVLDRAVKGELQTFRKCFPVAIVPVGWYESVCSLWIISIGCLKSGMAVNLSGENTHGQGWRRDTGGTHQESTTGEPKRGQEANSKHEEQLTIFQSKTVNLKTGDKKLFTPSVFAVRQLDFVSGFIGFPIYFFLFCPFLCALQICLPPSVDLLRTKTCFHNSRFLSQALEFFFVFFFSKDLLSPSRSTLRWGANRTTWKQGHAGLGKTKIDRR